MIKKSVVLSLLLSLFVFTACEIGLGEAVDTEAPTLTITNPPVDAVIRDAFAFSGTYSDDGTITGVTVTLQRTDGAGSARTFNGSISSSTGSGTWKCVIDPLVRENGNPKLDSYDFPVHAIEDGTYEATVSVTDAGQHKTIKTRTITIDNTAPLLVLQRPSTKLGDATFDSYGQILSLEGQCADDNTISQIEVDVYEDEYYTTKLGETIVLTNVPPTIELDFAKVYKDPGTDEEKIKLNTSYANIYGHAVNGNSPVTEQRYIKLRIYDDAQRYPVDGSAQTAADKLGNSTNKYSLYSQISSSILSSNKITDVYHMLNGSYNLSNNSRNAAPANVDDIKSKLKTSFIESGKFEMNPDNNPTFIVSARKTLSTADKNDGRDLKTDSSYQLTSGNTNLEIEVSPGRDKILIQKETLGYYLQECDVNGVIDTTKEKIYIVKPYKDKDGNDLGLTQAEISARELMITPSGNSYKLKRTDYADGTKFTIDVNGSYFTGDYKLTKEKCYRIVVVGFDQNKNPISNPDSDLYGIYLKMATSGIELELQYPEDSPDWYSDLPEAAAANKEISVILNYNLGALVSNTNEFEIYRNGKENGTKIVDPAITLSQYTDKVSTVDAGKAGSFIKKDANGKYYLEYQIHRTDDTGDSFLIKTKNIKIDSRKPEVSNITYPSTDATQNDEIVFKGKAKDYSVAGSTANGSGVNKIVLEVVSGTYSTGEIDIEGASSWSKEIAASSYPTVFGTEGEKTVKVYAVDEVGLKSEVKTKSDWVYDTARPSLSMSKYSTADGDTALSVLNSKANFYIGKEFKLHGSASDNYGVQSIVVTQKKNNEATGKNVLNLINLTDASKSFVVEKLPRGNGDDAVLESGTNKYTYTITVTDLAGKTTSNTIEVTVDKEAPTVSISTPATTAFGESAISGADYVFRGEAKDSGTDGTGMSKLYYAFTTSAAVPADSDWIVMDAVDGAWNFSKTLGTGTSGAGKDLFEGKKWLHVKAADKAGNMSSIVSRAFFIDQTKPSTSYSVKKTVGATDTDLGSAAEIKINAGDSFTISGTATDVNGVKSVSIKYGDVTAITLIPDSDGKWSNTYTAEGTYDFTITVEDKSGNGLAGSDAIGGRTSSISRTVIFDKTLPTVTIDALDTSANVAEASQYWIKGTGKAYISGTALDGQSGVASRTISIDGAVAVALPTSNNWTYELDLSGVAENTNDAASVHSVLVTVTDNVGNVKTATGYFRYDKASPTMSDLASVPANIKADGSITITGKAYDSVGATVAASRPVKEIILSAERKAPGNSTYDEYDLSTFATTDNTASGKKLKLKFDTSAVGTYGKFEHTFTGAAAGGLAEGSYRFSVVATDYAGNSTETKTVNVTVDRTEPTASAATVTTSAAWTDSNNSNRKWYNSSQLKVEVLKSSITENGSGIATVKGIAIDATAAANTIIEDNAAIFNLKTRAAGGSTEEYYEGYVNAPVQGLNSIYILLEDNAGNKKTQSLTSAYVDTELPAEATVKKIDSATTGLGQKLVNGESNVTVYIDVKDKNSETADKSTGIKSVVLEKIGNKAPTKTLAATYDSVNDVWVTTIDKDDLDTGAVKFKIVDNAFAGTSNYYSFTAFQMVKDNTYPKAEITSYPNAVNKSITISGVASDDQNLKEVKLQYSTDNSTWTDLAAPVGTFTGTTSWTATIDTTKLTDGQNYYFRASALDEAGNRGNSGFVRSGTNDFDASLTKALTVNQDSDRPEIKFTNISLANLAAGKAVSCADTKILCLVTDDDGIADGAASVWYTTKATPAAADWTSLAVSNGAFTITLADGKYETLKLKVTDKAGTTFTCGAAQQLESPKLTDGTNNFGYKGGVPANATTVLNVKVDTQIPQVLALEYKLTGETEWKTDIASVLFGGKKNKITFRQYAYDVNGIESVKLNVENVTSAGSEIALTAAVTPVTKVVSETTYTEYVSAEIDVNASGSPWASETKSCSVVVSDGVNSKTTSFLMGIDNEAPDVKITSPEATTAVYGSVAAIGTAEAGAKLSYTISLDGTNAPSKDKAFTSWDGFERTAEGNKGSAKTGTVTSKKAAAYTDLNSTGLTWTLNFDGSSANDGKNHHKKLVNYLTDFGITADVENFQPFVNLYLWIKAEDSVGNTVEKPFTLMFDPQGDRPKITIEYPENNGDSVGGTVKVYGSAEDNEYVDSAWVQVLSSNHQETPIDTGAYTFTAGASSAATYGDPAAATFAVTTRDLDYWASVGYTVCKIKSPATTWTAGTSALATGETADDYAIKAEFSGSTWSLKINGKKEFNASGDSTSTLNVRVFAWDGANISYPSSRKFILDNNEPYFENEKLVQYDENDAVVAEKVYAETGICVKGSWSLIFDAKDNNKVAKVTIDGTDQTPAVITAVNNKTYKFALATGTAGSVGEVKHTVVITDDAGREKTKEFIVKYDNKAPVLAGSTHKNYAIKPKVQQSNGFYTIKSFVSDAVDGKNPSGVDSVAFYFLRRSNTTIYDPMIKNSAINLSGTKYEDGLFWREKTVSASGSTLTLGAADANIHASGLVKYAGALYKVSSISADGKTITLDSAPASTTQTKALFAMAMVVNNTVSEYAKTDKQADGYYLTPGNDDGDRMIEVLDGTSVEKTWEAQICSRNIPDGPIEIHYVAFDKAGNYSIGIVGNVAQSVYETYTTDDAKDTISVYTYDSSNPAYISNNTPRVVSVTVGSDFDNSGTIGDLEGETVTKYYSAENGKANEVIDNFIVSTVADQAGAARGNGIMQLKSKTTITPEVIGGNGKLKYDYCITTPAADATSSYAPALSDLTFSSLAEFAASGSNANDEYLESDGFVKDSLKVTKAIDFTAATLQAAGNSTVSVPSWFTFRIIDSTVDVATGVADNQYATVQIALANRTNDTTAPNVSVDPFYWNNLEDNSLYGNSYKNGHIDLSKDLVDAAEGKTWPANYLDPKVSGIISFRGTALDDHRLGSIWAKFGGIACGNAVGGAAADANGYYKVAEWTYDAGTDKWTLACATPKNAGGTEVSVGGAKWKFQVLKESWSEAGQLIEWQLDLDTSAISGGYKNGVKLQVIAKDAATTVHTSSEAVQKPSAATVVPGQQVYSAKEYNVPYYQVDIVPYISGVQNASGTDAARSRLGRYPVQAGQEIKIKGFNFGDVNDLKVYRTKPKAGGGTEDEELTVDTDNSDSTCITITAPDYSGYIRAVWETDDSAVSTPNNSNVNKRYNISEGLVVEDADSGLAKANAAGKNFWSDDVYLSVWMVGTELDKSYYPISGTIDKSEKAGKIYTSATGRSSLAADTIVGLWGSDDEMMYNYYVDSGASRYKGFSNDASGNFITPPSYSDMCFIRNLPNADLSYNDGQDKTQSKEDLNLPYYVFLDNGNQNGSTWGCGLMAVRDGSSIQKSWNTAASGYTIESQSGDKTMNQFMSPKITGMWNPSGTYKVNGKENTNGNIQMYVCYYDKFSRCLKYASYNYSPVIYSADSDCKATFDVYSENKAVCDDCVVAGTDTNERKTTFAEDVGLYCDIKADYSAANGIRPVIIYYSSTNKRLEVAYGSKMSPKGKSEWNKLHLSRPKGSVNFGGYVSFDLDASYNAHIVAQDITNGGALYYGYISHSDLVSGTTDGKELEVDWSPIDATSNSTWIDIKLEEPGNSGSSAKPVISYRNNAEADLNKAVRIAYVDSIYVDEDSKSFIIWDSVPVTSKYSTTDQKLSIIAKPKNSDGNYERYAVGINASVYEIDFLRGEK